MQHHVIKVLFVFHVVVDMTKRTRATLRLRRADRVAARWMRWAWPKEEDGTDELIECACDEFMCEGTSTDRVIYGQAEAIALASGLPSSFNLLPWRRNLKEPKVP